jgi:hypothetical protein
VLAGPCHPAQFVLFALSPPCTFERSVSVVISHREIRSHPPRPCACFALGLCALCAVQLRNISGHLGLVGCLSRGCLKLLLAFLEGYVPASAASARTL